MKKETTKKSKLWIWIVAAAVLLLAVGGGALALLGGGGQQVDTPPTTDPIPTGPRADLYWNLDREFYTANSQTGLSTREADENGQFKMKFAYNGEIVELVIVDKKLVNIIDTQDVVGLQFDENGVVIGQINVRELATEVGKKVYVKKATDDMIIANSSMAMNGMELNLKLGQYSEIYDLREGSETYGKKIAPADLGIMDCMTVYANAEGDNTHFYILSAATRSKIYWRADLWTSGAQNKAGLTVDKDGYTILPFYADGEYVEVKTNNTQIIEYYTSEMSRTSFATGLIFDDDGYATDVLNAGVGIAGQRLVAAMDIVEINGNYVKMKQNVSTSGAMNWEGEIPDDAAIYALGSWAYSEGISGKKLSVSDLKVNDRLIIYADLDGKPVEIGLINRIYDLKPMYNNNQKYDAATRTTTRVKDADGYWVYTFIDEKGIHKYKTKDQKLANFIDSYPEKTFGIVTKGEKIVKAYEYYNLFGQIRFSTALYVDSINSSIISCTDKSKANAYTGILSEDYKVLDISGDSKQWGQKIKLQVGDCMISFKNLNKEVCHIYVTKRSMGGKPYVITAPSSSRAPEITYEEDGTTIKSALWRYQATDQNGKQVELTLDAKYNAKTGAYDNKYLQSRIDGASQGIIALEVSKNKIKDAHAIGNMASGGAVSTTIITKAGSTEWEFTTSAKIGATVYPGWTGKDGLKKLNLSPDVKSYKGEKLSGSMKVGDVYYMIRNRANETTHLFLLNRGMQKDLYFVKDYAKDPETGIYTFNMMYQGKAKVLTVETEELASALIGKANGSVLELDGTKVTAVYASSYSTDAYSAVISNWDVSKISGKKLTLKLNLPVSGSEVGATQEIDVTGAKIYNLAPDAGDGFGKTTSLKKGDRVRIYTSRTGKVSYVHVLVRNASKTALCPHCNKKVTWNAVTSASGLGDGTGTAHYYIYEDMEVGDRFINITTSTGGVNAILDLNGKTVTHVDSGNRMMMLNYSNSLTVLDTSEGQTGVLQSYGYVGNGNIMQMTYGFKFTLLSGTLRHLNAEGKVSVNQGGVIFSYNTKDYDRNIINIKGGKIEGGVVTHNSGGTATGAIHAYYTDITMTGGAIFGGTADRGGNINLTGTSTFTMKGGELHSGTARDVGGNIFANSGTTVNVEGGKIYGGNANNGGGNIYAYGANVNIVGSEVLDGTAKTNGANIFLTNGGLMSLNNATATGGIYAASSCGLTVAGDTKVTADNYGLRIAKGGVLLVDQLAETAKVAVYADGEFAKADEGSNVDVEAYMNNQIFTADSDCTLSVVTDGNGVKWLSAKIPSQTEVGQMIADKAVKMTTDGIFNVAEGQEAGLVEADCPVCKKTVTWAPMSVDLLKLDSGEHTHYYLAEDIVLADKKFQTTSNTGSVICLHLNGKSITQTNSKTGYMGALSVYGGTTMNIMGNGNVTGSGILYQGLYGGGAIDVRGNVNIYGGTYMSNVDRPAVALFAGSGANLNMYAGEIVGNPETASGDFSSNVRMYHSTHIFNLYGGKISGGKATNGANIMVAGGTFNISGGEVDGGVYATGAAKLTINNGANIAATNGGLTLSGVKVTLAKDLAEGTKVYLTDEANAGAVLTVANDKAAEYANVYILSADPDNTVKVNDANELYIPGVVVITFDELDALLDTPVPEGQEYHKTICPACLTKAEWVPLTTENMTLSGGHYYLAADLTLTGKTKFQTAADTVTCIHLNSHTYSQDVTVSQEGAFKVTGGSTLNLMDGSANAGTVIGVGTAVASVDSFTGGAIDARGNVNIYGGTYKSSAPNRPAVGSWNTASNIKMYGGVIAKSDAVTDTSEAGSSSVRIRSGSFTMYGGTITGGMAAQGGNIIVEKSGTLTVAGGTIGGDVCLVGTAKLNINNGANIAATNGGVTISSTATVKLAEDLAEGTLVYITDGAGEGAALTAANPKAADYAQTFICSADETKVVKADAENKLYITAP